MPQSTHDRVAELNNLSEHAHDKAAVSHDQNATLSGHELSGQGSEQKRDSDQHAQNLKHGKALSDAVKAVPGNAKP